MRKILKTGGIFILCLAFLAGNPGVVMAKGESTFIKDILKIVTAQAIFAKIAPIIGLGPKKTKEQKAQEKKEKEEEKKDKEIAKAEKAANKKEKADDAVDNPDTRIGKVKKWAEAGDVEAQCIMYYAYEKGNRAPQNHEQANKWKQKALKQNEDLVNEFIPNVYFDNDVPMGRLFALAGRRAHLGFYVKQDVKDAIRWSTLGAEEKDPMAISYIASAYYTGRGMPKDVKRAVQLAESTYKEKLSLYILIDAYKKGRGVKQDIDRSEKYEKYLKLVYPKSENKAKEARQKAVRDAMKAEND
ncbi:MAG: sel1 repeat family protein [Selenomonadaceae bacterium]|nr:sel1 repeat family protein [Selenomonadaceae bacterium]